MSNPLAPLVDAFTESVVRHCGRLLLPVQGEAGEYSVDVPERCAWLPAHQFHGDVAIEGARLRMQMEITDWNGANRKALVKWKCIGRC